MPLNPFHRLPNKREVWAWGMYDLANQSFTLLITTLFFGIYFKDFVVDDPDRGQLLWGRSFSISALIVVAISPLLGAIADYTALKKEFLVASGLGCVALTCSLSLVQEGQVALAMTLYIAANVCFMTGENFLGAFLPEIATRKTMGRISGIGWTMGYIGALVCLPLALLLPGVKEQSPSGFRAVFLFAGLWFLLNSIPTFLFVKEKTVRRRLPAGANVLTIGFKRNIESALQVRRFSQLAIFLSAFLIYSCAVQTIIVFAGIIAKQYLGQGVTAGGTEIPGGVLLIGFVWVLALVSGLGSFLALSIQDTVGHKLTLGTSLVVWILTTLGAAALPEDDVSLWYVGAVGVGVGLGLGVVGPSSRAVVGLLAPKQKTAEFFALWGLAYKLAGAIGPALYGMVVAYASTSAGMLLQAGLFTIGLAGLLMVDLSRGSDVAEEYERTHEISEPEQPAVARPGTGPPA